MQCPLVIGVTSHRNLAAGEIDGLRSRVRSLFAQLKEDYPELPLMVLSALAEGGDRLVAEEALAAGARLVAVLPLPAELYIEDFRGKPSRESFTRLCQQSQLVQMPLLPRSSVEGVAATGSQRDAQYAEAGIYIASHCHILLALWDGRDSDLTGGTAQIVRYHLDGILPGSIDRRRSSRPLFEHGDESLLCHLACSRQQPDGTLSAPVAPLIPLQMQWVCRHEELEQSAYIPAEFELMFRRMVQYNRDQARHRAAILGACPEIGNEDAGDTIGALFCASDWLAIHFQRRVLLAMRGIHVLAVLMGVAFIAYSDLPGDLFDLAPMLYVFIVLFLAGLGLDRLARRREWHRKYIDYRALAEGLRVQRYWQLAGVSSDRSVAFSHDNFMQKQDVELGWIRNVMRAAGVRPDVGTPPPPADIDSVIADWIGTPEEGGQLGYYARKCAERSRIAATASRLGTLCLWTGIGIGLALAVFHRWLDADTSTLLVACMGLLALVAAARESYTYRKADRELIKQYRYMRQLFSGARRALDAEPDPLARQEILRALGEAALAEHAEWALMHRERPLEHGRL